MQDRTLAERMVDYGTGKYLSQIRCPHRRNRQTGRRRIPHFEEKKDIPENEQEVILKDILDDTILEEGEEPLTPEETAWIAVLSNELGIPFMKKAIQEGKVPD